MAAQAVLLEDAKARLGGDAAAAGWGRLGKHGARQGRHTDGRNRQTHD